MFKVKALYEYTSGHEDDLSFPVGQVITITDEEDPDWYGGEYVDHAGSKHEGIFPRNFVEKYEPTAPPRPVRRATTKREKTSDAPGPDAPSAALPLPSPALASPVLLSSPPPPDPSNDHHAAHPETPPRVTSPPPVSAGAGSAPAEVPAPPTTHPAPTETPRLTSPPPLPKHADAAPQLSSPSRAKPAPPSQPKPSGPPPPVSEKPVTSSFRDRIAAFNKQAAPPIAPFKPSGLASGSSNFIKKPFVAPPPSRNAYVPPPRDVPVARVYRRDEDPEIKEREAETQESAERAGLVPGRLAGADGGGGGGGEAEEDQPKPLSLKERLALLQKQQMEQASRHADTAAKKEKPKRPPKKRLDSHEVAATPSEERTEPPPLERRETAGSTDESHPPRAAHPIRRRSSREPEPRDGNEADMSGAGETTEGLDELTEREDGEDKGKQRVPAAVPEEEEEDDDDDNDAKGEVENQDEEENEDEDEDPEARRKEELRMRIAKMSGGMGMHGMFGGAMMGMPAVSAPVKKKRQPSGDKSRSDEVESNPASPRAPPVPTMMALPGLYSAKSQPEPEDEAGQDDEDGSHAQTPLQAPSSPRSQVSGAPPPLPGGRPAPPPVPSEARPPPPPPPAGGVSMSEGAESDDEMSEQHTAGEAASPEGSSMSRASRAPPPPPVVVPSPPSMPPASPGSGHSRQKSMDQEMQPMSSPTSGSSSKRASRAPPPIPVFSPAAPPAQSRPPPPPPPPGPALPSRRPTGLDTSLDDEAEEITEYEGDYDTDIASSVPHKNALEARQRESSLDDSASLQSPMGEPPAAPPRGPPPPPLPAQAPPLPTSRKSVDMPRAAPPPPPPPPLPAKVYDDDDYDPYNYGGSSSQATVPSGPHMSPLIPPDAYSAESGTHTAMPTLNLRGAPPAVSSAAARGVRQSVDRGNRRSMDLARPSMDAGFVAGDIDLTTQTGWWLQSRGLPAQLTGRRDMLFESEESSTATSSASRKRVTRDIYVLFQDYSQTIITAEFDPQNPLAAAGELARLEQRHDAPPRTPRQDQLEQSYERFGRAIGEAAAARKDTVVGDGSPQALVMELLRPLRDSLPPVGNRAWGAVVYSNLANASTSQADEIRPGDILSVRNARFQGKHGAMHAKYTAEVGKGLPDGAPHVAIVAEWDGTKKKVRAWEQGRESKKVKLESFKLDDLRSGEVKIWRVMPRSWVGWEGENKNGPGEGGGAGPGMGGDGAGSGGGGSGSGGGDGGNV